MLEGMAVALLSGGVGAAIAQPGPVVQVRTHAEPVVLVVSWMPRPPTVSAGTAHLVEHLSYAAAPGWSPGAWDQALEQMGGWSEGWTTPAGVGGLVVAPAEALEDVVSMELQRLQPPPLERRSGAALQAQWRVVQREAELHPESSSAQIYDDPRQPDLQGVLSIEDWWQPQHATVLLVVPEGQGSAARALASRLGRSVVESDAVVGVLNDPWSVPTPSGAWLRRALGPPIPEAPSPTVFALGTGHTADPAALELLARSQGWDVTSDRVELPGDWTGPLRPPTRDSRRSRALGGVGDLALHHHLGWGATPASTPALRRVSSERLAVALDTVCRAPRMGPALQGLPKDCGAPTIHTPVTPEWPADPPWLVQVDLPGRSTVQLLALIPLGGASPDGLQVAAWRLWGATSGPACRSLRETEGLVYDLGTLLIAEPGRSALRLDMRIPADQVSSVLRSAESLRTALSTDPLGALGGLAALRGAAVALALQHQLNPNPVALFVDHGDPAAPISDRYRALTDDDLRAGAHALTSRPITWVVVGDPERLHAALSVAGIRPDHRWTAEALRAAAQD